MTVRRVTNLIWELKGETSTKSVSVKPWSLLPSPQIKRGQGNIFLSSTSPLLIIFCSLYPLHPNISMHILHTVLYTFHKVLTRRIIQSSRTCFVGDHFLHSCDLDFWVRGDTVERNQMLITPRGQRVKRS